MEFIIGVIIGIIITIFVSLKIAKKITGDENNFNETYDRFKNRKDIEENNEYDKRIENWKNETK